MAFGLITTDSVVQVGEKFRIDATKSFAQKGSSPISIVRIKPEASESFITVTSLVPKPSEFLLDWVYQTAGVKTIEVEITLVDLTIQVFTKTAEVLTAAQDYLYSTDEDLMGYESLVMKYLDDGRSSFNILHRKAQEMILDWLDELGLKKDDGLRLIKTDVPVLKEVKALSSQTALALLFEGISNKTDDVFSEKARKYRNLANASKQRGNIQLLLKAEAPTEKNDTYLRSVRIVR